MLCNGSLIEIDLMLEKRSKTKMADERPEVTSTQIKMNESIDHVLRATVLQMGDNLTNELQSEHMTAHGVVAK